jgi:hypothetical protein
VWYLHGGRQGDQILVEWSRSHRPFTYSQELSENPKTQPAWGLRLWTQTPRRFDFQAPWVGVRIPTMTDSPGAPQVELMISDVTSDGHPDVLVEQYPGTNHGCGPHQVVSTHAGITRLVFRANICETPLGARRGLLTLQYGTGALPAVCCPSKLAKLRLRWNGRRFIVVWRRVVRASSG